MADSKFVKLNHSEALPKLQRLTDQKETVKIWERGTNPQLYRVCDVHSLKLGGAHTVFVKVFSEGLDTDKTVMEKKVYIGFSQGEMDYFSEGIISLDETDGNLVLKLTKSLYRSEKRGDERLLTFPHHQVYAYFKIESDDDENVIPLKKEEDDMFANFQNAKREKVLELLKSHVDSTDDLAGFRAMDISRSGIAFTVGDEEAAFFNNNTSFNFIILFDGEVINIEDAKMVYKVDFVSGAKAASNFKVGLNFNPLKKLTKTIDHILNSGEGASESQKDFENFVDE